MTVYKFKSRKKIKLSFFAQLGINMFEGELFFKKRESEIPPTFLELEGLTLLTITRFESRKLIYADFLETVYPLILWSGEECLLDQCLSKEKIDERINELINDPNEDHVSKLFSITPSDKLKLTDEEYAYIQKKFDFEFPLLPESLTIKPKRPTLPPMAAL